MPIELLEIPLTVTTKLNQRAFDNLVTKSGQPCRWLYSMPCPCIEKTGSADPQCNLCNGRGYVYDFVKELTVYHEQAKIVCDRILKIAHPTITKILTVRHKENGIWYGYETKIKDNNHIEINSCEPFNKTNRFFVDYIFNPELDFEYTGIYQGNGHIVIDDLLLLYPKIGKIKPDITQIISISSDVEVIRFYKNTVIINDENNIYNVGDTFEIKGKFIPPYTFPVSSVNVRNTYEGSFLLQGGDAVATVHGFISIGINDVITVLGSEHRRSAIMSRDSSKDYDIIPSFDVRDIMEIFEIDDNGNKKNFIKDTDFVLRGRNELYWINNAPSYKYSIMYFANASFTVQPQAPSLRNHQEGRFPRKLMLKYVDKISDNEV